MNSVGSQYLPFKSDSGMINEFLNKNGDWRNLSQLTLMYYEIRLLQIRSRLYGNMVDAPIPTKELIQGVIDKLDSALLNINEVTLTQVTFSEMSVPTSLINHPYINVIRGFLGKGMTIERAISAASDELEVPEKFIYRFFKDNGIDLDDKCNVNSEAYKVGYKNGLNNNSKSDFLSVIEDAKKLGFTKSEDVINYIKGFCQSNKSLNFSMDNLSNLPNEVHKLLNASLVNRGKITSDILNNYKF